MEEPQVLLVKCPHCSNRLKLKFNTPKRPETLTCTVCKQTSPFGSFAVVNNAPAAPVKSGGCETDLLVGAAQRPAASASGVETDLFVGGVGARVASSAGSGETDLYLGGAGARVAPSAGSGETDLYLRGARDRHNSGNDGDGYPCLAYLVEKIVEQIVVKKHLSGEKRKSRVHLFSEIADVLALSRALGMYLGVARTADTKIRSAPAYVTDKVDRVSVRPA